MASHNLTKVLMRNSDLLEAKYPLLVNLPADDFLQSYADLYPQSQISYYSSNFLNYLTTEQQKSPSVRNVFSATYESDVEHDLAIIAFPKSKAELNYTLAMISGVLTEDATLLILGENKGGIKSLEKLTKSTLENCRKIDSARHCTLFMATIKPSKQSFNIEDWFKFYTFELNDIAIKVASLPGVFSQNQLDSGTQLLLDNFNENIHGEILDFGCGAGVISCYISKKYQHTNFTLVDISALALFSAQKTLQINNLTGRCIASDSLSHLEGTFNHVISNPPFHQGIKTNYQATESFLSKIKSHIKPKGSITVVANSFLKYQPIMESEIGKTEIVAKKNGFSIYRCNRT